ncbi:MAG: hypothetical protein ACUVS2_16120 [Candidatus Flexifilum sp.]|jgi:hypothetical protein
MPKYTAFFILFAWLAIAVGGLHAQDTANTTPIVNPVEITWPVPVSEVFFSGDVIGTAAVDGLMYYYLEYIQLNDDLSIPENAPWIPATAAQTTPVINGPLATLDTTTVPDGLYALRLVVVNDRQEAYTDTVTPIRVNNTRFSAYTQRVIDEALAGIGLPTPPPLPPPTQEPPPPASPPIALPGPGLLAVNVRYCDQVDNVGCPIVAALDQAGAIVTALSANGTGWYLIQLLGGMTGWVSPTVVTIVGDTSGLPFVAPPAPLPPPAAPNVVLNGIAIRGGSATCGVPFEVEINVANAGTAVADGATVTVQDINIRTGEITATAYGTFPALNPGGNFVVVVPLTTSVYFNEAHEVRASLGSETVRTQYTLQQGNCGVQPPPPPPPTAVPPPPIYNFRPNQCFIVLTSPWPAFEAPYGQLLTQLAARAWEATGVQYVNGEAWYSVAPPDLTTVWLNRVEPFLQGGCDPRAR